MGLARPQRSQVRVDPCHFPLRPLPFGEELPLSVHAVRLGGTRRTARDLRPEPIHLGHRPPFGHPHGVGLIRVEACACNPCMPVDGRAPHPV